MALAPCLIGYGAIARRLYDDADHTVQGEENNRYWKWIENYVAEDYVTAVKTGSGKSLSLFFSYETVCGLDWADLGLVDSITGRTYASGFAE